MEFGEFPIEHKDGRANVVADALSRVRIPSLVKDYKEKLCASLTRVVSEFGQMVVQAQTNDLEVQELSRKLEFPFSLENNVLYYKGRLYLPRVDELIRQVLVHYHDRPEAGHFGGRKTYELIKRKYFWREMKSDILNHCKTCEICQRVKVPRVKPAGLLEPLPIPAGRWSSISMDFITCLPRTQRLHEQVWVTPFFDSFLCKMTKMTPFFAMNGRHPRTSLELGLVSLEAGKKGDTEASDLAKELDDILVVCRKNLQAAQDRAVKFANRKRSFKEFQVGDQVYVRVVFPSASTRRTLAPLKSEKCDKLSPRFSGPFEILERIGKVAYRLQLPRGVKVHPVFHVSQLKGVMTRYEAQVEDSWMFLDDE